MSLTPTIHEGDEPAAVAELVGGGRVLDCGCGSGRIAAAVRPAAESVWGIELSEKSAAAAASSCDRVIVGDLADANTWAQLSGAAFDAVLFIHVLEHLIDPPAAIRAAVSCLRPGGRLVIALPNVATWRTRWQLVRGRWDYQDEGIMDRTHVRFYTFKTAVELLETSGLRIRTARLFITPPSGNRLRRGVVRGLRRIAPLLFAHSFLFEAVPARPGPADE